MASLKERTELGSCEQRNLKAPLNSFEHDISNLLFKFKFAYAEAACQVLQTELQIPRAAKTGRTSTRLGAACDGVLNVKCLGKKKKKSF